MEQSLKYCIIFLCGFACGSVLAITCQSEARKVKYVIIKESQIERLYGQEDAQSHREDAHGRG